MVVHHHETVYCEKNWAAILKVKATVRDYIIKIVLYQEQIKLICLRLPELVAEPTEVTHGCIAHVQKIHICRFVLGRLLHMCRSFSEESIASLTLKAKECPSFGGSRLLRLVQYKEALLFIDVQFGEFHAKADLSKSQPH